MRHTRTQGTDVLCEWSGERVVVTSLIRREFDRLIRHLVDDVERLERPALPRGLLLDDAYFLLAVHCFGLGWRAARAVVRWRRPARGDIIFCAGFDSSTTWTMTVATSQGETAGPRGGEELIEARSGLENSF